MSCFFFAFFTLCDLFLFLFLFCFIFFLLLFFVIVVVVVVDGRLFTTTMVAFGVQKVWYNTDLLANQLQGLINYSQGDPPYHSLTFYINYETTNEQLAQFEIEFQKFVSKNLKGVCSDSVYYYVCTCDVFMKSQVMVMVLSYVPFSNINVRWEAFDKLYRGIRETCQKLGIKSSFNMDNVRAAAVTGLQQNQTS